MPIYKLPFTICHLTDKNGKLLDPYTPGSIKFRVLNSSRDCNPMQSEPNPKKSRITVLIDGYITIYIETKGLTEPIPFHIEKHIQIYNPKDTFLDFSVIDFQCHCNPVMSEDCSTVVQVQAFINIDTIVRSSKYEDVIVDALCPKEEMCINVQRVYDCGCFKSSTSIEHDLILQAAVMQYNARSDGIKKNYTDADELTDYGCVGILSPDMVSYYDLYVNSLLQPKVNYSMTEGHLDLHTIDAPIVGASMVLAYVEFEKNHGKDVTVTNEYYCALSTGTKRVFTNSDAITEYGDKGIPSPGDVSFFNLYVNGVLQPSINYTVEEGILQFRTDDLPMAGAMIVLESLYIKDSDNMLLSAEIYQYNALSDGKKIYTDSDEMTAYGDEGILDPELNSYLNLFINGVLQPQVTYTVRKGLLVLNTTDAPLAGAPVMIQFLRVLPS